MSNTWMQELPHDNVIILLEALFKVPLLQLSEPIKLDKLEWIWALGSLQVVDQSPIDDFESPSNPFNLQKGPQHWKNLVGSLTGEHSDA